jgi:hypothetical protein
MIKTKAAKIKKNKRKYDQLKDETDKTKRAFEKRQKQGTYKSNINMDNPYGEDEDDRKPPASNRKNKGPVFCEYCGRSGHLTKRSKDCIAPANCTVKKYRRDDGSLLSDITGEEATLDAVTALAAAARAVLDGDCDIMDSLPFDTQEESDNETDLLVQAFMDDNDDDSVGIVRDII